MADLQAAKRYAQAAFHIALEHGTITAWRSDLHDIAQVLSDSEIAPALADGRLPLINRLDMVARTLAISPLALNLARLLVQKGRSLDARAVSDAFDRMADEYEGISHAKITTAVELTPEQLRGIEQQLSASLSRSVRAVGVVDPSIIGGVVVRIGDRLVDGSVRTQLNQLRRELEGAH